MKELKEKKSKPYFLGFRLNKQTGMALLLHKISDQQAHT
jgi:hypothetical protein